MSYRSMVLTGVYPGGFIQSMTTHEGSLSPADVITQFRDAHEGFGPLNDYRLDMMLYGDSIHKIETAVFPPSSSYPVSDKEAVYRERRGTYGSEIPWDMTTHRTVTDFETIRGTVHAFELTAEDVVLDAGSGYGRLPLYVGMVTQARSMGVEMVQARTDVAEAARQRLGLDRVKLVTAQILGADISKATKVFMYQPFTLRTTDEFNSVLRAEAKKRQLTIAYNGGTPEPDNIDWIDFDTEQFVPRRGAHPNDNDGYTPVTIYKTKA